MAHKHVVNFSGGAGSYAAAHRVVERFGAGDTVLLTADTMSEADDWLPFINAAAERLGAELVLLRDGRDIWQLARDKRIIPSNRVSVCTRNLKTAVMDQWRKANCDPQHTTCYFGFDWTEEHRLARVKAVLDPWQAEAPLLWAPVFTKDDALRLIEEHDLPFPMAYQLGLPHNNCLKYGCVKGGQAYWRAIYDQLPDVFARAEAKEQEMRDLVGHHSMLLDRQGGEPKPLPLSELRRRIEVRPSMLDVNDWGSCSCMTD